MSEELGESLRSSQFYEFFVCSGVGGDGGQSTTNNHVDRRTNSNGGPTKEDLMASGYIFRHCFA